MQFIITIPDKCVTNDTCFMEWVENAGKDFRFDILPKGHGRLIDATVLRQKMGNLAGFDLLGRCIDEEPTIVEADGGDVE